MKLSQPLAFGFCVFSIFVIGCVNATTVIPYKAQPERIVDPQAEILSFIRNNTDSSCLAEPTFEKKTLRVKFVCNGGIGNWQARLDRIKEIAFEQNGAWYRLNLKHTDKSDDFRWSSKNPEEVQRAIDAFHLLMHLTPPADPATPDLDLESTI
ncbi:MAG: hypothetical protein LBM75_09455 [Myxococcales bacterium]|nr:hypothetical protein [Myxococcales bacterium]